MKLKRSLLFYSIFIVFCFVVTEAQLTPRADIQVPPLDNNPPGGNTTASSTSTGSTTTTTSSLSTSSTSAQTSSTSTTSTTTTSSTSSTSSSSSGSTSSPASNSQSSQSSASDTGTPSQNTNTGTNTGTVTVTTTGPAAATNTSSTAAPSQSDTSDDDSGGSSSLGTGSIIGLSVAGGVAVLGIVGFFIWKFTRKRFSDFDDNEAIKWPELNAHNNSVNESHPLPLHNTGRAGFDTGSELSLSRAPSEQAGYSDYSGTDPYAVPPLPHLNPSQPYRDDPSQGYYDPYRGPVPNTLDNSTDWHQQGEAIPMTQMGRTSPGPAMAYDPTGRSTPAGGRMSPGPAPAYGAGRTSPGPQMAYGRSSPGPQAAYDPYGAGQR